MTYENQIFDRTLELNNGLLVLKHRYDGNIIYGESIGGDSKVIDRTLAEALTEMNFTPHPLGQITFYFGRTAFDVDGAGFNLYHWSTTPANMSQAIYEYIRTGTYNSLGYEIVNPTIVGYGRLLPVEYGWEGAITFYEEDRLVSSIRTPDGYMIAGGYNFPFWYAADGSNPGTPYLNPFAGMYDFYGTQISQKKIGDKVCRLVGMIPETATYNWSASPDAVLEGTYGDIVFYWIPEYKHIPFTETLFTKQYYRRPLITYLTQNKSIYWNSETNGFFSIRNETLEYNLPTLRQEGKFNRVRSNVNDAYYLGLGSNTGRRSNNKGKYVYKGYNDISADILSPTITGDLYVDVDYTIKDISVENDNISVTTYRIMGSDAYYGSTFNYESSNAGAIFDLFKTRDNVVETYVKDDDFNLTISGSIIRNKTNYMTDGKLDLDKIYNSNSTFLVDGAFANISDRNTLNYCKYIVFSHVENDFSESVYFINDERNTTDNDIEAPYGYYDFDVTIESGPNGSYYSDNSDTFDGGGLGAITGSGTMTLTNESVFYGGSSKKVLYFNGSGTLNECRIDAYQTDRDFVVAIDENFDERWRTNHLSPTFSLPFPNSGILEKPNDGFQTISCGVADNDRLFIAGNTVGVFPRLTVNNSDEYEQKVSRYNEKIQNCL